MYRIASSVSSVFIRNLSLPHHITRYDGAQHGLSIFTWKEIRPTFTKDKREKDEEKWESRMP